MEPIFGSQKRIMHFGRDVFGAWPFLGVDNFDDNLLAFFHRRPVVPSLLRPALFALSAALILKNWDFAKLRRRHRVATIRGRYGLERRIAQQREAALTAAGGNPSCGIFLSLKDPLHVL